MKKHHTTLRSLVITIWGVLVLTVLAASIAVTGLIENSLEAKQRYETLLAVDAAGGDVEKALLDLRSFMYAHMNTTIGSDMGVYPPIQLSGTYNRLVLAEKERVKLVNESLYAKAQEECEKQFPTGFSGGGRIPCITEYVAKNAVTEQAIPEGLYKYDFVSPKWSADKAGYGIAITVILLIVFLIQLIAYARFKHHMHLSQ